MVVVAAVLARLVARPFIAERVAARGRGEAWVGAAAGAALPVTAGAQSPPWWAREPPS